MLSRRAPLFGVVGLTQVTGIAGALALALLRGESLPGWPDVGWAIGAGAAGMFGITFLYRGLAVGRMGVVAPVTGVVGAAIPVLVGFVLEGVPRPLAIAGIVVAMLAVVLVTRAPGHHADKPTGVEWALGAGLAIGLFNICIGQFGGSSLFLLLVLIRIVQAILMSATIVLWRQPWRLPREIVPRIAVVGTLDVIGNGAFILAASVGQLAIATVLSSLYPVTTVLLAIVVLRERLTRSHVAGIALTAAAITMIALGTGAA
jgi:drug/metabolite transporter (DMT)-like permease